MSTGMQHLALPDHGVKLKQEAGAVLLFDPLRRKWVVATPEEWVRQHFLNHLVHDLGYPPGRIAVEHGLKLNGRGQRTDALVFDAQGLPLLLLECKAPQVAITQRTFDQVGRYNSVFHVQYLMVTNGLVHYCCQIGPQGGTFTFLPELPRYARLERPNGNLTS
jgi:hypothetical protein